MKAFLTLLLMLTKVLGNNTDAQSYTVCVDNSSLINQLPQLQGIGNYVSFKKDCYPGSESEKPNKIKIRVFPSMPLYKEVIGKCTTKKCKTSKLITHVNQLFTESNKLFVNQLNIKLVPEVVVPRPTDPSPINGGINVLGDLNTFGVYTRSIKNSVYDLFITNNYQGIVGAAYIGTIGREYFNYAVSLNKDSVMSHEILHGMGAQHTFGKGGVQDYYNRLINGVLQMHPDNKPQVCPTLTYYFNAIKKG